MSNQSHTHDDMKMYGEIKLYAGSALKMHTYPHIGVTSVRRDRRVVGDRLQTVVAYDSGNLEVLGRFVGRKPKHYRQCLRWIRNVRLPPFVIRVFEAI